MRLQNVPLITSELDRFQTTFKKNGFESLLVNDINKDIENNNIIKKGESI